MIRLESVNRTAKGAQRMVRAKGLSDTVAEDIKRLLDDTE